MWGNFKSVFAAVGIKDLVGIDTHCDDQYVTLAFLYKIDLTYGL